MARGVNKVIIIGNAGNDAEVKFMPSGAAVANVNIATSESWKDKQTGQMQERTEWHRVSFMDRGSFRLGQIAGDFIKKGTKVYVEGSLRTREWEKDGIKRYTTEIVANEMQLLDGKGEGGQSEQQAPQQQGGFNQQTKPHPQSFGSWGNNQQQDPRWQGVQGTAMTNGATIEQIQKKFNGSFDQALKAGAIEQKPQQAPSFDDFDDDIPF